MAGSSNMYRVGDYVYFEPSSMQPYQIRRIEELNKTSTGGVEARVTCLFRRRDVSSTVTELADKHHEEAVQQFETNGGGDGGNGVKREGLAKIAALSDEQKHCLKHKELFLSRQVEVLPATHIRGKCTVNLLNEAEDLEDYINSPDTFFYLLIYDPQQKTLSSDQNDIEVGEEFQAVVPEMLGEDDAYEREESNLETLVWTPEHELSDRQIDQYLTVARSVGTFARGLDTTISARQPSLHVNAANASRDLTLVTAMDILHKCNYDLAKAISSLVPNGGPLLCRDEFEDWSSNEAELFEEALSKYGKDFRDIRQDFVTWRALKSIVEFYYFWKSSDRYVKHKREKAAESDSKLKQVYIPAFNKPSPALISNNKAGPQQQQQGAAGVAGLVKYRCESCLTTDSGEWYAWGQAQTYKICGTCWSYWKHYGGLKQQTGGLDGREHSQQQYACSDCKRPFFRLERLRQHRETAHRIYNCAVQGCPVEFGSKNDLVVHCEKVHNMTVSVGAAGNKTLLRSRYSFYLHTTTVTKYARYVCADVIRPTCIGRHPFKCVDMALVKQHLKTRAGEDMDKINAESIKAFKDKMKRRTYGSVDVVARLLSDQRLSTVQQQIPKSPRRSVMGNMKPAHNPYGSKPKVGGDAYGQQQQQQQANRAAAATASAAAAALQQQQLQLQQQRAAAAAMAAAATASANATAATTNGVGGAGVKRPAAAVPNTNGMDELMLKRPRTFVSHNGSMRPHQHIRKDDGGVSYMFSVKRRRKLIEKLRQQVEDKVLKKASRKPDFIVDRHLKRVK